MGLSTTHTFHVWVAAKIEKIKFRFFFIKFSNPILKSQHHSNEMDQCDSCRSFSVHVPSSERMTVGDTIVKQWVPFNNNIWLYLIGDWRMRMAEANPTEIRIAPLYHRHIGVSTSVPVQCITRFALFHFDLHNMEAGSTTMRHFMLRVVFPGRRYESKLYTNTPDYMRVSFEWINLLLKLLISRAFNIPFEFHW